MRVRVKVNQVDVHRLEVGSAGPHHARRVSGSQLSGTPDAGVADRRAAARFPRRCARSRRSSTSTRSTEISRPICRPPSTCCRRRAPVPLGSPARRPMRLWALGAIVALVGGGGWFALGPTASADAGVETAEVVRGDFIDVLPIRGEVRARRTVPITAPRGAGELQIVFLAPSGAAVKAGDVVDPLRHVDRRTPARREALGAARGRGGDPARARRQHDQRPGGAQRRDQAPLRRRAREARRLDQRSGLAARRREGGHLARRRRAARARSGDEGHRQRGDVAGVDGRARAAPREGARRRAPRGDAAGGADAEGAGSTASSRSA